MVDFKIMSGSVDIIDFETLNTAFQYSEKCTKVFEDNNLTREEIFELIDHDSSQSIEINDLCFLQEHLDVKQFSLVKNILKKHGFNIYSDIPANNFLEVFDEANLLPSATIRIKSSKECIQNVGILFNDPDFLIAGAKILYTSGQEWTVGVLLKNLTESYKSNRYLFTQLIKISPLLLAFASDELKSDRELVRLALSKDGAALQFASPGLCDDKELAVLATKSYPEAAIYVGKKLAHDPDFLKMYPYAHLSYAAELITDKRLALDLAKISVEFIYRYDEKLLDDDLFMDQLAQLDPANLCHASDRLLHNLDFLSKYKNKILEFYYSLPDEVKDKSQVQYWYEEALQKEEKLNAEEEFLEVNSNEEPASENTRPHDEDKLPAKNKAPIEVKLPVEADNFSEHFKYFCDAINSGLSYDDIRNSKSKFACEMITRLENYYDKNPYFKLLVENQLVSSETIMANLIFESIHLFSQLDAQIQTAIWPHIQERFKSSKISIDAESFKTPQSFIEACNKLTYEMKRFSSMKALAILLTNQTKADLSDKPCAVLFYPKTDWNGAFSQSRIADTLVDSEKFNVLYYEVGSVEEMKKITADLKTRSVKLSKVFIAGHGAPDSLLLSASGSFDESNLDIDDINDGDLDFLIQAMNSHSQLFLYSCSNGNRGELTTNMANSIARRIPKTSSVHAFRTPTNIREIYVEEDGTIRLKSFGGNLTVKLNGKLAAVSNGES